jgi:hypothetical protein
VVKVAGLKTAQLADPDPGGVEQLEHGGVTQGHGGFGRSRSFGRRSGNRAGLGRRPGPAGGLVQVGQHGRHLVLAQHVRQDAAGLQGAEPGARIGRQPAAAVGEGGERPGRGTPPGQRRTGRARFVLDGQPAAQHG